MVCELKNMKLSNKNLDNSFIFPRSKLLILGNVLFRNILEMFKNVIQKIAVTPVRCNHFNSLKSKRRGRRFGDEMVPDVYRWAKQAYSPLYYNVQVANNRMGDSNRKVRHYKAIFARKAKHDQTADMSNERDNFRDAHRSDWF